MNTSTTVRELRVRLRAPDPSSFDNPGGPGGSLGWLERPASGDYIGPCLRGFWSSDREAELAVNPSAEGIPTLEVESAIGAQPMQAFEVPVRLDWSGVHGDTAWKRLNLSLYLPPTSSQLVDVVATPDSELRWRHERGVLSIAVNHADAKVFAPNVLRLQMRAGSTSEIIRPQQLDVRVTDDFNNVALPLVTIAPSEITQSVGTVVTDFWVTLDSHIAVIHWRLQQTLGKLRLLAHGESTVREVNLNPSARASGTTPNAQFRSGETSSYSLELRLSTEDDWVEIARMNAPTILANTLAMTFRPNPVVSESRVHMSFRSRAAGTLDIFDLRGGGFATGPSLRTLRAGPCFVEPIQPPIGRLSDVPSPREPSASCPGP